MGLLEFSGMSNLEGQSHIGVVTSECCHAPWLIIICSKSCGHSYICSRCGKMAGIGLHLLLLETMQKQAELGKIGCDPSLNCEGRSAILRALEKRGISFPMDAARKTSGN